MDEKRKILDMVAEGKITAEEAAKLLAAMNPKPVPTAKGKRLVFQIIQEGSEKPKVNIAFPLKLAKFGMNFIPKNGKINADLGDTDFDISSINWQEIIEMASSGETGELFYMEVDEENGTPITIRIFVE
ncbi:MAG: hypothetical protein K8R49_02645 [Candidatus Cloacimonetes bacterium]|nr:hypothetical protein [Candidatus Cloacimonadota bacterium]